VGTEIQKTRPAVVVSSDAVGRLPIKLVSPLTDGKAYFAPNIWHVRIDPDPTNGLTKVSAVDTLQYRRAYEAHRRAVPGVVALLAHLHPRLCVGVVTNGLVAAQREKMVACQLAGCIDFLLTSEEAQVKKPDPRLCLLALENAQTQREDAVVLGDSWTFDVLGAHQAGIRSLWLNRRHEPCPDPRLATELSAFEPLDHTLKALEAT